ncbi:MAG: DUF1287 domain-containing protein [Lachnospiraceae bacterium]|nr:DUF1287 domain-containing protein [Lachnospiraceae bacterium]
MSDSRGARPHESGQNSTKKNAGNRSRRTRDREAEATIREMRQSEANRRQTVARDKKRRVKQMRGRITAVSILLIMAITGGAAYGAVQSGWLDGGEISQKLVAERGIFSGWSPDSKNGMNTADVTEETVSTAEQTAEEKAAAYNEKAGKMRGVIATAKIKADDPEDVDGDGIANQQDIFQSAKDYVATKPVYEDRYYQTGYPDDGYGVCTDVIGFAFLGAGFNLQMLVKSDIEENIEDYSEMEKPDPKIDFRRVKNLDVFFQHTAEVLPTSLDDLSQWLPGDIVTWERHIGIISDRKNERGVPYVIHHAGVSQTEYEEDILEGKSRYTYVREITGHYRVS